MQKLISSLSCLYLCLLSTTSQAENTIHWLNDSIEDSAQPTGVNNEHKSTLKETNVTLTPIYANLCQFKTDIKKAPFGAFT